MIKVNEPKSINGIKKSNLYDFHLKEEKCCYDKNIVKKKKSFQSKKKSDINLKTEFYIECVKCNKISLKKKNQINSTVYICSKCGLKKCENHFKKDKKCDCLCNEENCANTLIYSNYDSEFCCKDHTKNICAYCKTDLIKCHCNNRCEKCKKIIFEDKNIYHSCN